MTTRQGMLPVLLAAVTVTAGGCFTDYVSPFAEGDAPTTGSTQSAICETTSPGASPLRRLTRDEYDATVADLLGDTTHPARAFATDATVSGFDNNASVLTVPAALADQYVSAAQALAATAITDVAKLTGCSASLNEEACAHQFIADFGKRAFRRPLSQEEQDILFATYTVGRTDGTHAEGIELALTSMLVAPQFLYRTETAGAAIGDGEEKVVRVSPYEMASRLSYLITGSMPDAELFRAAEARELDTDDGVKAQVDRLLALDDAKAQILNVERQWLRLGKLESVPKNADIYPEFTSEVRGLLRQESDAFLNDVFWNQTSSLDALLTGTYSFRNAKLASYYGDNQGTGDSLARVDLDGSRTAGILTQGAFLTVNGSPDMGNPVRRGKFVRDVLLCQALPPAPDVIEFPDVDPTLTTRERFAEHSTNPACAGCHALMDPIGFGFENYDGIGRFMATEAGKPLDGAGELTGTDVDGVFHGAAELGKKLAKSGTVQACVAKQWFRYAQGRLETDADKCTLEFLQKELAQSGNSLRALLVAITRADSFRFRTQGGSL